MANIFPFRALRYNPERVSVNDVVTQPYDKITPEMQEKYYQASPHNLVRIILGRQERGDKDRSNVYARAAEYFRSWRNEAILVPDPQPSIYVYSQQFSVPTELGKTYERRGFIALGQLEPYDTGMIYRHEQTLSGPKLDRLNLLRATKAHFGQLFMLYNDPAGEIDEALVKITRYAPNVEVCDEYNVRHRLWVAPGIADLVSRKMADKKLIIADGHHRYETALNYQAERRAHNGKAAGDEPYDRVMMTFINMYTEGVVILPTHRVLSGLAGFSPADFEKKAEQYFEVESAPADLDGREATDLLREQAERGTVILAVTRGKNFMLRLRPGAGDALLSQLSPQQRELDVVILHKVLIEGVLGVSEEAVREQKHIAYVRGAQEALERVRGGANLACLINPVRVGQVRDIAFAGEVLPQKSTDFYPKLLSGLTIYALE
jgi:uncharacterized protein (DUF1015 family)